ncbi:hypothetical protein C8Q80DRAFT_57973 [Daedaleopsis nitida]|nr:hypothetical protein C8Q80DRAFT_57973 [Daedaleopsis nitida]
MNASPSISAVLQADILHHVFTHELLDQTLLNAALVCRSWTDPAQSALYRDLAFSTIDNHKRDALLARTMRMSHHLRRHVRRLTLTTLWTHSPTPDMCDWIQLLPAHCVREFQWVWLRGHILSAVLDYPAVRTVAHMTLKGRFYTASKLQPVLELPHLRSLALEISGHEAGELYPPTSTRLEHLSVHLTAGYGPIFDKLLAAAGGRLNSFRLLCQMGCAPDEDAQLLAAIKAHIPTTLARLDISANFMLNKPMPFLDGLVRHYRTLQHLHCAEDTYSAGLLDELPPTLRTLHFSFRHATMPHEAALLSFLKARKCHALTTLTFTTPDNAAQFMPFVDACRQCEVDFTHTTNTVGSERDGNHRNGR